MHTFTRIVLSLVAVICLGLFVRIGITSSDTVGSIGIYYAISVLFLVLGLLNLFFAYKKTTRPKVGILIAIGTVVLGMLLMSQLNCSSRCISTDSQKHTQMFAAEIPLEQYYQEHGTYPDQAPIKEGAGITYTHTMKSYALCATPTYYFFGIPLHNGEPFCITHEYYR